MTTSDKWTALMKASYKGHANIVDLLLAKGANQYIESDKGMTALMVASKWGHADVVKLLLAANGEPDLCNTIMNRRFGSRVGGVVVQTLSSCFWPKVLIQKRAI